MFFFCFCLQSGKMTHRNPPHHNISRFEQRPRRTLQLASSAVFSLCKHTAGMQRGFLVNQFIARSRGACRICEWKLKSWLRATFSRRLCAWNRREKEGRGTKEERKETRRRWAALFLFDCLCGMLLHPQPPAASTPTTHNPPFFLFSPQAVLGSVMSF